MADTDDLPELDDLPPVEGSPGTLARIDPYQGVSLLELNDRQAAILTRPVDPVQVDILPTGAPYMQQVNYRRTLNEAFGPGRWGMKPLSPLTMREKILFREWALYVGGHFVASAVGQQEYFEDNDRQTFADAAESVKSNAIMRCCKDLGIAAECWDRRWAEAFRREHCVQVQVRRKKRDGGITLVEQWRRKDQDPLPYEVASERTESRRETIDVDAKAEQNAPPKDGSQVRPEDGRAPGADATGLKKVYFPSDVFQAGNAAKWSTKQLNRFIQDKFGKTVSQLEKGDECGLAVKAVEDAAATPA